MKAEERATSADDYRRVSVGVSVQQYSVQCKGYNLIGVTTVEVSTTRCTTALVYWQLNSSLYTVAVQGCWITPNWSDRRQGCRQVYTVLHIHKQLSYKWEKVYTYSSRSRCTYTCTAKAASAVADELCIADVLQVQQHLSCIYCSTCVTPDSSSWVEYSRWISSTVAVEQMRSMSITVGVHAQIAVKLYTTSGWQV
jgi:hypothetical protein